MDKIQDCIKKIKENKYIIKIKQILTKYKTPINILINIILVALLLITLNIMFIDNPKDMLNLYRWPTLIFSVTLFYLIFLVLTTITKKTNRSILILSILILSITTISNIKYSYTETPLYISDISLAKNLGEISTLAKDITQIIPYKKLIQTIVILIAINIVAKLSTQQITGKPRILTCSITLILTTFLIAPIEPKDNFLLKNLYKQQERIDYNIDTNIMNYYKKYGVVGGIYETIIENRFNTPENYKKEETEEILASTTPVDETDLGKPNIIVMFQESYWDIQKLDEIKFDKDITQVFKNLTQEGTHINMISPTYGGSSANVEFEILTGANMSFFNKGYLPFMQMYRDQRSSKNPSIINELKNNGYYTKMMFGRDFYLSEPVYKNLGIDEYINAFEDWDNYEQKVKGDHLSDEALVDAVIENLQNKDKDEKLFYMTATIETHMPFDEHKYDEYDMQIVESELDEKDNKTILAYTQGVYDSNQQLQRLYDFIKTYDEPTIILFFGDHLPILRDTKGDDLLLGLRYFNTGDEKQDIFRKYNTEALILNNYDKKIEFDTKYISPDMLLTTVINKMDIQISPYYQWLYKHSKELPALNQFIYSDKEGNIGLIEPTNERDKQLYNERLNMQYANFIQNMK